MAVIATLRVSVSCVTGRNTGILLSSLDIFLIINDLCFFSFDDSCSAIGRPVRRWMSPDKLFLAWVFVIQHTFDFFQITIVFGRLYPQQPAE